jgi:hypothetical protein
MTAIARQIARGLVHKGKAREVAILKPNNWGEQYIALDRLDIFRTDHYRATGEDIARWEQAIAGGA